MKLFKKLRKGFTLIELVVVIAVIAILSAVSVVSYVAITNKAKESNDHMMIDQINTSVEASSIPSRKATLHEVLEDLKEDAGFGVEKLAPELKDAEFVYSYSMNKFAYWKKDKVVYPKDVAESSEATGEDLWFFVNIGEETALRKGHSYYAKSAPAGKSIEVDGGFDVGSQSFSSISYVNTASAKDVVIRTNSSSTKLTINAKDDTVNHYGVVGNVDAQKIDMNCYNEYGKAAYVKVTEGKVVAKNGSEISIIFANNTDSSKVAVSKDKTGIIKRGLTTVESVDTANYANYSVHLEYSADGVTPYTAEAIEAIGQLSVASETGVQPEGMDYVAVVNCVGYDSLEGAINAAGSGDKVTMLKDVNLSSIAGSLSYYVMGSARTSNVSILLDKSITLNGGNHRLTSNITSGSFNSVIGITGNNLNIAIDDLIINTSKMSDIFVETNSKNLTLSLNNSKLKCASYCVKVCAGVDNMNLSVESCSFDTWNVLNMGCNDSKISIKNSDLLGVNATSPSGDNSYGTIVFDGMSHNYGDSSYGSDSWKHGQHGKHGCRNTLTIENTVITSVTESTNNQHWLNIQCGAQYNTVTVDALSKVNPQVHWNFSRSYCEDQT